MLAWVLTFVILLLATPLAVRAWLQDPGVHDSKTHIRYMAWGTPQQQDIEREFIAQFEKVHPDIRVDYLGIPTAQYFQKLRVMLASHTEADVFRCDLYY